jgi:hypothetical protein
MAINYDPDGAPDLDPAMSREAERLGMHIVHVVCDKPGAKVGGQTGVSFYAIVPFIPRAGDRIGLEDGKVCVVKGVIFGVVSREAADGGGTVTIMVPNVVATRMRSPQKDRG